MTSDMKVLLTIDIHSRKWSVDFPKDGWSDLSKKAALHTGQDWIDSHELTERLHTTPEIMNALDVLKDEDRSLYDKVKAELLNPDPTISHGSVGTYAKTCHGPLCTYAKRHDRKGDISEEPSFYHIDWCLYHLIISHRLYQKVVRNLRIEIW